MPEYMTQQEAFLKCKKEGKIIIREDTDKEKIQKMIIIADGDRDAAITLKKSIPKESNQWNGVYKLSYDALHQLAEAYLFFDKVKVDNHQCLFAYLCEKYSKLELHWEFLEKVRTKRNGIQYYGTCIRYEDWKEVELEFQLSLKLLREAVKERLKE